MLLINKQVGIYILAVVLGLTMTVASAEEKPSRTRQIEIIAKIEITEKMAKKPAEETALTINLMATENAQAIIEKGFEIALQGMPAVNQAAGNEFRSALMRLHVLPRITEAGHILLEFDLRLDEPMQDDYIMFSKRRLNTTNLIQNQNTALVGRIYEEKGENSLEIKIYMMPSILDEAL